MTPLRLRMIEDMQIRYLAALTQKSYIEHIARFARHFDKSPEHLGPDEIRSWLLHLDRDKHLAPSTMGVAVAAFRFCYTVTLGRTWTVETEIPASRQPNRLPTVLSPEEVAAFLGAVKTVKKCVILTVCYAAGLRVSEAVHLKPAAIDSQRMVIRVEAGKGGKDRYVMLSPRPLHILRAY
jgi:integrase/recombinase XerD